MPARRTKYNRKARNSKKRGNKNYRTRRNTRRYNKVKVGGGDGHYDDRTSEGAMSDNTPDYVKYIGKTFTYDNKNYTIQDYNNDKGEYDVRASNNNEDKYVIKSDEINEYINI